jgi:hypothetical protein
MMIPYIPQAVVAVHSTKFKTKDSLFGFLATEVHTFIWSRNVYGLRMVH